MITIAYIVFLYIPQNQVSKGPSDCSLVRDPEVVSAILDRADVGFWTSLTERVPHRSAWHV